MDANIVERIAPNAVRKHDLHADVLDRALKIVEKFIIDRQLILVGGMAIDLALRRKNDRIYDDDAVPDYDFLSPQFHVDAYDLGNMLVEDFPSISVINARHPSTLRVRVNFVSVADITYVPPNIYERVPTIQYGKMRVVAPSFQYIDQHRSLSFPYEDPPLETILFRWKKDMQRYDMLYKHYPIHAKSLVFPATHSLRYYTFRCPSRAFFEHCLAGVPAIAYWLQLAKQHGFTTEFKGLNGSAISESEVRIRAPKSCMISVLSDDPQRFMHQTEAYRRTFKSGQHSSKPNTKHFHPLLDKFPECWRYGVFEVMNNREGLAAAHRPWPKLPMFIANLQHVMGYLTVQYFWHKDTDIWAVLYGVCRQIVAWASDRYDQTRDTMYMPFLPYTEVYGLSNRSEVYRIYREDMERKIGKLPPPVHQIKPKAAYPEKDKKIDPKLYQFDPSHSPIYQFDAMLIDPDAEDPNESHHDGESDGESNDA